MKELSRDEAKNLCDSQSIAYEQVTTQLVRQFEEVGDPVGRGGPQSAIRLYRFQRCWFARQAERIGRCDPEQRFLQTASGIPVSAPPHPEQEPMLHPQNLLVALDEPCQQE